MHRRALSARLRRAWYLPSIAPMTRSQAGGEARGGDVPRDFQRGAALADVLPDCGDSAGLRRCGAVSCGTALAGTAATVSFALSVFLGVFVAALLLGMPVAWSMGFAALLYLVISGHWALLPLLPEKLFQGMDSFVLVAIPMFLLAGDIFSEGGITARLVVFADKLFGWIRGGIAQVAVGAAIFFSGITGVALWRDRGARATFIFPRWCRDGYPAPLAAAIIASASIIGPTIPPSLPIIIYGSVTNVSIGGMFAAAVVPGLVIGLANMLLIAWLAQRLGIRSVPSDRSLSEIAKAGWRALLRWECRR